MRPVYQFQQCFTINVIAICYSCLFFVTTANAHDEIFFAIIFKVFCLRDQITGHNINQTDRLLDMGDQKIYNKLMLMEELKCYNIAMNVNKLPYTA